MPLNPLTLVPASSKAKDVATLNDLGTHVTSAVQVTPVSNTTDGLSGSPVGTPIKGSTYTYTGDVNNVMYTYTASGWEQGGTPGALTVSDFGPANESFIDGGVINAGTSINSPIINSGVMNSGVISGGTITGGTIDGTLITGAIIRASYIDLTSVESLTNWAVVTNMNTIPVQYWDNFAQNDLGNPIPDINGKYRLYTTTPLYISSASGSIAQSGSYQSDAHTWDDYTVVGKKMITESGLLLPSGILTFSGGVDLGFPSEYYGGGGNSTVYILGNEFRFEYYAEKLHYGDLSLNYNYVKFYFNGVLDYTLTAAGGSDTSSNRNKVVSGITISVSLRVVNQLSVIWGDDPTPGGHYARYTLSIPASVNSRVLTPKTGYTGSILYAEHHAKDAVTYVSQSYTNVNPYMNYSVSQMEIEQYIS
jgi:hypothetical protein